MHLRRSAPALVISLTLSAMCGALLPGGSALAAPVASTGAVAGETGGSGGAVTVVYADDASPAQREQVRFGSGAAAFSASVPTQTDHLQVPAGESASDFAASLRALPGVRFALPTVPVHKADAPDWLGGPDNRQWNLRNDTQPISGLDGRKVAGVFNADVDAPEAWQDLKTTGSRSTIVAVIDSGVDINHPDLAPAIWDNPRPTLTGHDGSHDVHGWDFCHDDGSVYDPKELDPEEDDGSLNDLHGTHIAGIIAAANDGKGVVGVAPGVTIMPLKVFGASADGEICSSDGIWDALIYAAQHGAKVINASWTLEATDPRDRAEIDSLLTALGKQYGVVIAAAAGNGDPGNGVRAGIDLDKFPGAAYPASSEAPNVITVAAVDNTGRLAPFSNYGRNSVDVEAPGVGIWSTVPQAVNGGSYDKAYGYLDGTSMATPHVAAIAALLYGLRKLPAAEAVSRLRLSTKPIAGERRTAAWILSADRIERPATLLTAEPVLDPVVDGAQSTVVATLRNATTLAPLAGQRVRPCVRTLTTAFSCGAALRTDARGHAVWRGRITRTTIVQWRFPGAPNIPAAAGANSIVHLAYVVSLQASATRVRVGRSVTFSGQVTPRASGVHVVLLKAVRGDWVPVLNGRTTSRGSFSFVLRVTSSKAAGTYAVGVYPDARHTASLSRDRTLRIG